MAVGAELKKILSAYPMSTYLQRQADWEAVGGFVSDRQRRWFFDAQARHYFCSLLPKKSRWSWGRDGVPPLTVFVPWASDHGLL